MSKSRISAIDKVALIDKIISEKEEMLQDFRSNQKNKLDQASNDDMDNRHIDSKNEETLFEMDLLNNNVEILEKEIMVLKNIPIDMEMQQVQFGSLVETTKSIVIVGAAHETTQFEGVGVVGISTAAPLFKMMQGKKKGEKFELNGTEQEIISVK